MPRSWGHYLNTHALQWQMPGRAVQLDHGRGWHRINEETGWTDCKKWISEANNLIVGEGQERQSPWDGHSAISVKRLCIRCFAHEIPLIVLLNATMTQERMSKIWVDPTLTP